MNLAIAYNVRGFHRNLQEDRNHRYLSWEHCYRFFRDRGRTEGDTDTAALHLSFYLASWGMYRGSSFLLWKDYKVNCHVVDTLLLDRYRRLWQTSITTGPDDATAALVIELVEALRSGYSREIRMLKGKRVGKEGVKVSDTLVTKILLGTLGCTPAFDTYFLDGVRYVKDHTTAFACGPTLNTRNLRSLWEFYGSHERAFGSLGMRTQAGNLPYPPMKLVDMYFWSIGYREWLRTKAKKGNEEREVRRNH